MNFYAITEKFDPESSAIRVSLEVNKGEYNLNLRSVPTDNAMAEHAHTAAVLVSQGELLRKLGLKLLSKLWNWYLYKSEIPTYAVVWCLC